MKCWQYVSDTFFTQTQRKVSFTHFNTEIPTTLKHSLQNKDVTSCNTDQTGMVVTLHAFVGKASGSNLIPDLGYPHVLARQRLSITLSHNRIISVQFTFHHLSQNSMQCCIRNSEHYKIKYKRCFFAYLIGSNFRTTAMYHV